MKREIAVAMLILSLGFSNNLFAQTGNASVGGFV